MSKYQFAESEIYLPGTDIPRNRLGIEEPDLLHEVEATLLQQAYTRFITELDSSIRFDENYFKALHRDTYETVYEWAGLYRTVDMNKGGSLFCRATYLEQEASRIFRELDTSNTCNRPQAGPQKSLPNASRITSPNSSHYIRFTNSTDASPACSSTLSLCITATNP